jgi:cyanophycinase
VNKALIDIEISQNCFVYSIIRGSTIEILNIKDRTQANDKKLARILENVDLVFLTGGNQL